MSNRNLPQAQHATVVGMVLLILVCAAGCNNRAPTVEKTPEKQPVAADAPDVTKQPTNKASEAATEQVETLTTSPTDSSDTSSAAAPTALASLPEEAVSGSWTTRRLIALAPGGPVIIELALSVNGLNLEEAWRRETEIVAAEILDSLEAPVSWQELLEQPLVRSGWLGNLVPDDEQVGQVVGMYDTEADSRVTLEELRLFLARGLDRLRIADIGNAPQADTTTSPWGAADQDEDHSLTQTEMSSLPQIVAALDYNGDSIVSSRELDQSRQMSAASSNMSMSARSLLDANTLVDAAGIDSDDPAEANKSMRKMSSAVLQHYTFLEGIPRDQWRDWSDERWQQLDENDDGLLIRSELEHMSRMDADARFIARYPGVQQTGAESQLWSSDVESLPLAADSWASNEDGGRLSLGACIASVRMQDAFAPAARRVFRQRLEAALSEPQLKTLITGRLDLKDGAFELADTDGDEQLSDTEFAQVWRWLGVRQGSRVQAQWMIVGRPWFQLIDVDGDERLTVRELEQAPARLAGLDMNQDQTLTPNELPLLVRLEIARQDDRVSLDVFGESESTGDESVDSDWFAAMDTNRDGFVTDSEFLGERDDFQRLDTDKDGFIGRVEVYGAAEAY